MGENEQQPSIYAQLCMKQWENTKMSTNYTNITYNDGKWPIKALGDQLLSIDGVYHVKTWESHEIDTDGYIHGEIWVYASKHVKFAPIKAVLYANSIEPMWIYNDLYKSHNRRFKLDGIHIKMT